MERLLILEDAKQLKRLAAAFLHPERPVEVEFNAYARCYFDRPSAPEQETVEEAEERYAILKDAKDLKRLAADYAHPELKVNNTDYLSCARCYFDRPSAPEQESVEDANERALILQDVENLRKAALEYLHPELGVVTSDSTACARCYFDRPSAPRQADVTEPKSSSSTHVVQILPKVAKATPPKDVANKVLPSHNEVNIIRKSASAVQLYGLDDDHDSASFF